MLISFDNVIDTAINEKVMALHQAFKVDRFKGFIETVPAYSSLAVFYDTVAVKKYRAGEISVVEFVKKYTETLLSGLNDSITPANETIITVPVYYNGADIDELAKLHRMDVDELIKIHTVKTYRVFMIGFQPGFAYMGKLDERIATPRRANPRTTVPAGSVGIAGYQTGIYPFSSPGGWQLIGQTPLKIFDKQKNNPCLFAAGDKIKFISISKTEFDQQHEY